MSFFKELKRRNVFRVGIAYVVSAWLVVQVADVMIDNIGAPAWLFKFILLTLAVGLPVALVMAWAFELTPEGLKREKEVDRSQSVTLQTGRRLDFIIIGVLVLALSYFIYESRFTDREAEVTAAEETVQPAQPAPANKASGFSVAVLPFINLSNDADNEYFSDGLTETLLNMLAQLPGLQVAARTSSFAFKGKNEAIDKVANALGVDHVLEGSVQKADGQVRIIAQLIRADDGFPIWSQHYTRSMQDIFAIQDEIASDVAGALGASLLGDDRTEWHGVATENLGAYDSYLKGLKEQAVFSYTSLDEAEEHFKNALLDDPEFTEARLALVRNYFLKMETGVISEKASVAEITPLINRVLQTEPNNQVAQAYDLLNRTPRSDPGRTQAQLRERIAELRALLSHMPTDTYLRTLLARFYTGLLNDPEEALVLLQAGLAIDPLDAEIYMQMGATYAGMKDYDNAESAFRRATEIAPDSPNVFYNLARFEDGAGNLRGYFKNARKALELDPSDHELAADLAAKLYFLGLPEEAERWYQRLQALSPASPVARSMAVIRAYFHDRPEEVVQLSEQNIKDQIDNRHGAFIWTVLLYSDTMMKQKRSREAYDFLVSVRPEIAGLESRPGDEDGAIMQNFSVWLMFGFAGREEVVAAWDKYVALRNTFGYEWLAKDSESKTVDLWLHGDHQGAIDQFVDNLQEAPLSKEMYLTRRLMPAVYQDLWDQPVVAAAMAKRDREFAALQADINNLLQEPEWQH